ncbi:hypothetical protein [Vulcanisaeta sp. JCM 14467]|nr:hypothetical protein [Vulcanisaeta sp. JCM 14467]
MEHGINLDPGVAERVYEELCGNPGWLTYFGYRALGLALTRR